MLPDAVVPRYTSAERTMCCCWRGCVFQHLFLLSIFGQLTAEEHEAGDAATCAACGAFSLKVVLDMVTLASWAVCRGDWEG